MDEINIIKILKILQKHDLAPLGHSKIVENNGDFGSFCQPLCYTNELNVSSNVCL